MTSDIITWIAEILLDLLQAHDYYQQHDAQFDLDRVVNYIAELLIRSDAIRHHDRVQNPVPLLFVRGSAQDTTVAIGSARLVGLGCGATIQSSGATLGCRNYRRASCALAASWSNYKYSQLLKCDRSNSILSVRR